MMSRIHVWHERCFTVIPDLNSSEYNSTNYDEIPPFHEILRSILSNAVP